MCSGEHRAVRTSAVAPTVVEHLVAPIFWEPLHFERFESALWQTSSLLLVAEDEAVVIDPCISTEEVARIAGRARTLGARVTHVLVTHADWDHVCGIGAFPDAVATMGTGTAKIVASGGPLEAIGARAIRYGVEIEGEPRVDRELAVGRAHQVGPFVVETFALRGHTPDGTAYRIRELDLLAVGDHVSAVEFPFVSTTSEYRTTLTGLIELLQNDPPAHVVPGHGPALTGGEALTIAEADLVYLRALRDAVASGRGDRALARDAALGVPPPRSAPEEFAEMHAGNTEMQLEEFMP
jgi:glyoxylase-like metal-dependent hydrolase (beta-lactamase superfamily II)